MSEALVHVRHVIDELAEELVRTPLLGEGSPLAPSAIHAALEHAYATLAEEPWLVPQFAHEPIPEDAGRVLLRLAIAHTALDPLEVGEERAAVGRALVTRLSGSTSTSLTLATLEVLHPVPGASHVGDLGALLAAWEAKRGVPQTSAQFWAQKRVQNLRFFRAFFFAPFYALRAGRIARALPRALRARREVMETYGALVELGPVLDNFVFDLGPRALFADQTMIADFAFLYMQLADELVDNLAKIGGMDAVRGLVARLYAPGDRASRFVAFEDLTQAHLEHAGIDPRAPIPKYRTDVLGLIDILSALRAVLVHRIRGCADPERIEREARDFFHHCFATFLDELDLPTRARGVPLDELPLSDVAWHFYRKNNLVMSRWLALRARLLGLTPRDHAKAISTWGYVLATFQIFDDMKDIALDLGHQPSYALERAFTCHPEEHAFLTATYGPQPLAIDRNDVPRLMLGMPRTMRDCMRLSRVMALAFLEWFTDYVYDYRWRRNWLVRARSFHRAPAVDVPIEQLVRPDLVRAIHTGVPVVDALFRVIAATRALAHEHALDDEYLAFVLDAVGYDHGFTIMRAALPDVRTAYRFLNLRMRMTSAEKGALFVRVCQRHRAAATQALAQLRWATGSSALAFEIARRVGIEVTSPARRAPLLEA